jgi:hypothetical protein
MEIGALSETILNTTCMVDPKDADVVEEELGLTASTESLGEYAKSTDLR